MREGGLLKRTAPQKQKARPHPAQGMTLGAP
jgi:hypothetical protein